ncbi:MAG TPA: PadR family transcriptional regulator [Gemmatimonadaceae bacterium]|jgi:transcriptional regulator|nr:PadR family transcriptional regulator [Gemmatimonadaceae bacterium]HRQ78596.1 PadR family transcriptional regulator [Gemmatimonadaceae bacterium]
MAGPDLDIVRGTLDLILLKTLSWGPMHGLGIVRWIETVTRQQLLVEEGALYPALHRLEERGWLRAEWGLTPEGRRAKYYTLTPRGRQQLAAETSRWTRYATAMDRILAAEGNV